MSNASSFQRLLEPLYVKKLKFRNRIIKPPQRMSYADKDGSVTQRCLDFYETLARGGVGAIIVEHAYVDFPLGVRGIQLSGAEDRFIPSLAKLAEAIHRHGCPAIQQISHAGPQNVPPAPELQAVGPSVLNEDYMRKTLPRRYNVRPLTIDEIEAIVEKFAQAAQRAQKAGYDGVEIHGAHNYLLACFLSGVWNKREDKYGGSVENRARLVTEIVSAVRQSVSNNFIIGVRINGAEYGAEAGVTSAQSRQTGRLLEAAGADYLHVSADGYGDFSYFSVLPVMEPSEPLTPGLNEFDKKAISSGFVAPLAEAVKKVVTIPVITVGRLGPVEGEHILRAGMADAIAMGRRLLADPELPDKVARGGLEDIVPCISCGTCLDCNAKSLPVFCHVNPALGREGDSTIRPAEKCKRVVVAGSGPSGLEAARVAALRGHDVTVYEKEPKLGGLLLLASLIKNTEGKKLADLIKYYRNRLAVLEVKFKCDVEYTQALSEQIKPDVVIIAGGGTAGSLRIPGIIGRKVLTAEELKNRVKPFLDLLGPQIMRHLTSLWLPIGKRVVIIGGSIHGCEAAEFLVRRGRKVTIVDETDQPGAGIPELPMRKRLLNWFTKKGVTIYSGVKYKEMTDKGLAVTTKDGKDTILEADTVFVAIPLKPNVSLLLSLEGKASEVYLIGDARQPGLIGDAIADGSKIGGII